MIALLRGRTNHDSVAATEDFKRNPLQDEEIDQLAYGVSGTIVQWSGFGRIISVYGYAWDDLEVYVTPDLNSPQSTNLLWVRLNPGRTDVGGEPWTANNFASYTDGSSVNSIEPEFSWAGVAFLAGKILLAT